MPAIANISINDIVPNSHTFIPLETSATKCIWRTDDSSLPLVAQKIITISLSKSANGVYTIRIQVEVPILEVATGANSAGYTAAPKVAYSVKSDSKFHFPERAISLDRYNLWAFVVNGLNNPLVNASITNVALPY